MSVYEEFRGSLLRELGEAGVEVRPEGGWDPLPRHPCPGPCSLQHQTWRARREVSPNQPAVLYLPVGGASQPT